MATLKEIEMSYAFAVRGTTKAQVMEKVSAELEKVVAQQPIHSIDRWKAYETATEFLAMVPNETGDKEFYVSVSGSLGWIEGNVVTSACVNVQASLVAKEKA
jgi:L-fucose mutarotase/ribose pyranase (RbsD/FucU family)